MPGRFVFGCNPHDPLRKPRRPGLIVHVFAGSPARVIVLFGQTEESGSGTYITIKAQKQLAYPLSHDAHFFLGSLAAMNVTELQVAAPRLNKSDFRALMDWLKANQAAVEAQVKAGTEAARKPKDPENPEAK